MTSMTLRRRNFDRLHDPQNKCFIFIEDQTLEKVPKQKSFWHLPDRLIDTK